jgi:hypothetical protein
MSYRREFTIEKSPGETRKFSLNIEPEDPTLPELAITAIAVTAKDDATGSDATSTVIESSGTSFLGNVATFRVKNGTNGKSYKISVAVDLSNGDHWVADGTLKVNES